MGKDCPICYIGAVPTCCDDNKLLKPRQDCANGICDWVGSTPICCGMKSREVDEEEGGKAKKMVERQEECPSGICDWVGSTPICCGMKSREVDEEEEGAKEEKRQEECPNGICDWSGTMPICCA